MTMEALSRAERHPANQDTTKQFAIRQAREMLAAAGVKDPGSELGASSVAASIEKQQTKIEAIKIYPEISLEDEWNRQTQNLARIFAKELKFETTEAYMATLPKFEPQPENWKGRLATPVIVETRINPSRQCELAGIRYALDGISKTNWNKNLKNYTTPKAPYAAWLEDGRNNLNKKPEDVRKNLKDDEIAGTEFDGIALYIANPKILEHHFLDLPGTAVESVHAAYLILWHGGPMLSYFFVDRANPEFGSVVRGRQK